MDINARAALSAKVKQQVRAAALLDASPDDLAQMHCVECGARFVFRRGTGRPRCPRCAERLEIEQATEYHERGGSRYERSVCGQLRHWLAEARRLGLPLDGSPPPPAGRPGEPK